MSNQTRTLVIRAAGVLIVLLALVAALLPLASDVAERIITGGLLVAAGVIELAATAARRGRNICASIAAAATLLAGLRLALDAGANFFTVFNLVILWLVVRSAALALAGRGARKPVCHWMWIAAGVDFLLALFLLAGLPMTVLIVGIFGPTQEVVATFAWVFAASFVATAVLLFAAASLESGEADQASG